MTWRKVMAGFLTTAVAAGVLAGCAATPATQQPAAQPSQQPSAKLEKVTIEFWGWWNSATRRPTIEKIVGEFNKKYEGMIEVKYTFVPWDQMSTKLVASVAAGNPPDVIASTGLHETYFKASKRQTQDLSPFGAEELKGSFPEAIWNSVVYQGKPYALPWVGDTKWLYVNKKHLQEAGLNPDRDLPKTWTDLENLADKLSKRDGSKITRVGFHPLLGNFGIQGWVWNSGGTFFDDRGFPIVNSEKNLEVMNWLKKFNDKYGNEAFAAFRAGAQGTGNLFATEKVSMIIETPTHEGEIKKANPTFEYAIIPIPTPNGQQHKQSTYSGAFAIEVPAGAKNAKAGYEFAKFWATDAALIWGAEQSEFPFYVKGSTLTGGRSQLIAEHMAKYTAVFPMPIFAPAYLDAVSTARDDVLAGKKDAKKALDEAQNEILKMIRENSSR